MLRLCALPARCRLPSGLPSHRSYHGSRMCAGLVTDWFTGPRPSTVPYAVLTQTLGQIQTIPDRNSSLGALASMLRLVAHAGTCTDLARVAGLACGSVFPVYANKESAVGETILLKAVAAVTGVPLSDLETRLRSTGDIGDVMVDATGSLAASSSVSSGSGLSVEDVFRRLQSLAAEQGKDSTLRRQSTSEELFQACRHPHELRFLARTLAGAGLRVGLSEKSVVAALCHATVAQPPPTVDLCRQLDEGLLLGPAALPAKKADVDAVQTAFYSCPDLFALCDRMHTRGPAGITGTSESLVHVGIPILAMLGVASPSLAEVSAAILDKKDVTCEWKYDGERIQIHWDGTAATSFSRSGENTSFKFADALGLFGGPDSVLAPNVQSVVVEGEVVAFDRNRNVILPFSEVAARERGGKDLHVPRVALSKDPQASVCLFLFDLLYLNGQSQLHRPLRERRDLLRRSIVPKPSYCAFARGADFNVLPAGTELAVQVTTHRGGADAVSVTVPAISLQDSVSAEMASAVSSGCEGLMVKALSGAGSTYIPGSRTKAWLKLKQDYAGMAGGDTLDVVPIAGWWGRGKRASVIGSFLVATHENGTYSSLTKLGTGFTDAQLAKFTAELQRSSSPQRPPEFRVRPSEKPDVWFVPQQVWEIRAAELSLSPSHTAGSGHLGGDGKKGVGARFPRFLRAREDKRPTEATSDAQVAAVWLAKAGKTGPGTKGRTPPMDSEDAAAEHA